MKKLIILFLVISLALPCLTSCSYGAKYNKAQRLLEKGKVEDAYEILLELGDYKDAQDMLSHFYYAITRQEITYTGKTGIPSTSVETAVYNDDGNLVEWISTKINAGTSVKTLFTYDENGYLSGCQYFDASNEMLSEYKYSYDKNGNMTIEDKISYGAYRTYQEYTYDENGKLIKWFTGEARGEGILTPDGELAFPTKNIVEYTYDEDGNLIEVVTTRDNGSQSTTKYTYDKNGNCIKVTSSGLNTDYTYDEENRLIQEVSNGYKTTYEYDGNGNLIKEVYGSSTIEWTYDGERLLNEKYINRGNGIGSETEYIYNEYGELTKKLTYSKQDDTVKSTHTYIYDSNGNIIEYNREDANGITENTRTEYKMVYIPYEIPEWLETLFLSTPYT